MENIERKTDMEAEKKRERLLDGLRSFGSAAVAFSGGVDSTFLLETARDALGSRVIAVTAQSCLFPERELREAQTFCGERGIKLIVFSAEPLQIEGFGENPKNRCYLCKRALLLRIKQIAAENGMAAVIEGSNLDDMGDYRPGMQAVSELGVKSPLRDAGMTKDDIRYLSKRLGLSTWDKPSFACLASRFVYGETITKEKLEMVGGAESLLRDMGFCQFRVRIHGRMARIEIVPAEFDRIMQEETREKVVSAMKGYGFSHVALDLQGYRTGSMNEI